MREKFFMMKLFSSNTSWKKYVGVVNCSKTPRQLAVWGEKVEKTVQKNGEDTLAAKSPYLIVWDLGPFLIDK